MTYCAIFDLDETIIRAKSMIVVLEEYFHLYSSTKHIADIKINQLHRQLQTFADSDGKRSNLNRYFYQQLSGKSVHKMMQASKFWFQKNRNKIFNQSVVNTLNDHKEKGATIIVVTGSFYECVSAILNNLEIEHVVCANLEKINGYYTGEMLSEPTIGEGKTIALKKYLKDKNLSLEGSFAYGDHETDISMLSMACYPVVVGNHPGLCSYAREHGWDFI